MEPLAAFCFSSFVKLLEPYSSLKKSLIAAMKVETLQVCLLGRDLISALICSLWTVVSLRLGSFLASALMVFREQAPSLLS